MSKKFVFLIVMLITSGLLFAVEYIDVVKTKDGDIFKGIIIENKITEYIKIETSGGSTFKINYKDIESILKEKSIDNDSRSSIVINNANTNTQTQTQSTHSSKSKELPIRFTPRQGLFSVPYYSYYGVKYPLGSFGSGYINLATAIKSSVQPDLQLQTLLDNYSKDIATARTLTWTGFSAAMGGIIWYTGLAFEYLENSDSYSSEDDAMSDFISALTGPAILYLGGLIVEIIGTSMAAKEPVELVTHYNSNY